MKRELTNIKALAANQLAFVSVGAILGLANVTTLGRLSFELGALMFLLLAGSAIGILFQLLLLEKKQTEEDELE